MAQSKRKKASSTSTTSSTAKRSRKRPSTATTKNAVTKQNPTNGNTILPRKKPEGPISMPIVILDSGGWTVKHGTVIPKIKSKKDTEDNTTVPPTTTNNDDTPQTNETSAQVTYTETPNLTAKLRHQLAVLVGDEIYSVKNKAQLEFKHPLERGYCTDLECQLKVWKRVLQREHEKRFPDPSSTPSNPQPMGRFTKKLTKKKTLPTMPTFTESNPHCAFLLTQPFTPTALSDRIDEILFMNLGFQSVSKRLIQCMSAHNYLKTTKDTTSCCLVVDSGFSLTHIVPTLDTKAVENAIRRINIGGKLITNLYKEAISYRQWNMMDELFIMNEVKEKTSFVSNDFQHDLGHHARMKRPGYRWYDREFVLPDFVNTFSGNVRLPPPLRKQQMIKDKERLQKLEESLKEKMDEQDSSMGKKEKEETGKDMKEEKIIDDDDENGEDSDHESDEQQKEQLRLLKLQEQRRRELEQQEQQVLSLSVERFTIPEVLFHPSDIGLDQVGIVAGIVQAISACDPTLHAAMYQNIILTGGSVKLSGFRERLEKELRAATPDQYDVNITLPEDPIGYPWEGASDFVQTNGFLEKSCLDKYSWEESRTARKGKDDFFLWTKVHEGKEIEKDNYIVV